MQNSLSVYISIFLVLFCSSCVPESKKILTSVDLNPGDPMFQKIMDHEYAQEIDSLFDYFSHENPTYRYLVARSMASLKTEGSLDSLYKLLDDPVLKVRYMAAYAIGQIGSEQSESALLDAFRQKDTMSVDNIANAAILEALGKLGKKRLAGLLVNSKGYRNTDTLLHRGKTKSLYQFALRGIHNEEISSYLVSILRNKELDNETRLYAAHSLSRTKDLNIETIKFQIAEIFTEEEDKQIKMALALALSHTNDKEIQTILLNQLDSEDDPRVKINIIRALVNYDYIESAEKITELIKGPDQQVAIAACQFLYRNGIKEDVRLYRLISKEDLDWQVKAELLKAINKLLPYYFTKTLNASRWQIQELIRNEADTLVISHYLRSLSHDPAAYEWIISFLNKHNNSQLNTAGLETLKSILADENFNGTFKNYAPYHRRKILEYIMTSIESGDEGEVGMSAEIIADPNTLITEYIDSTEFLFKAKEKLNNPAQIESIHALDRAIAAIRGVKNANLTTVEGSKLPYWSLLNEFDSETKLIVKTNKGNFTIDLFMEHCPGTVLNFLQLSKDNYFDNKIFHRVVPNFVIQTGSPRSDNYGGMDYVINSELGPEYYNDDCYVGMASAGNHTESAQWFVTLSPTPHLDGKYTIFGKIIEGKDVVQNIELGDTILDIIINKL